MARFHWDLQQGSLQWYQLRSGIPTASEFASVMTPKTQKLAEGRKKYAMRLIAERILNWQADSLDKIQHIADGKAGEPLAVAQMELVFDIESRPVGFVTTSDGKFGASPDRVAGLHDTSVDQVIEVKVPTVPVQMERLIFGDDDAYKCQRQGQMWVAEADKAVFFSWNPRMPAYIIQDGRDEAFIRKLVDCLRQFDEELEEWTEHAKRLGAFQPFDLLTPTDAAYAERAGSDAEMERLVNHTTYDWGG